MTERKKPKEWDIFKRLEEVETLWLEQQETTKSVDEIARDGLRVAKLGFLMLVFGFCETWGDDESKRQGFGKAMIEIIDKMELTEETKDFVKGFTAILTA
ncbi:hypothetical protein ACFLS8_00810 [Chloroflexota bacterium]